jgi:hypothetical protein
MISGLIIAAFTLISCGTLPPPKPIRDLESIEGKWEGNLTVHRGQFGPVAKGATWDIHQDGTYEMATSRWRAKGTLRLDNGHLLFFDGPRASGFASLREGTEGKLLLSTGNEPGTSGTWWPVK